MSKAMPKLEWETLENCIERAAVPGGWLVKATEEVHMSFHEDQPPTEGYEWTSSIAFVPDPSHEW